MPYRSHFCHGRADQRPELATELPCAPFARAERVVAYPRPPPSRWFSPECRMSTRLTCCAFLGWRSAALPLPLLPAAAPTPGGEAFGAAASWVKTGGSIGRRERGDRLGYRYTRIRELA